MKARAYLLLIPVAVVIGFVLIPGAHEERVASTEVPTARRVIAPEKIAVAAPALPVAAAPTDNTEYPVDPTPATVEPPLTDAERAPKLARGIELLDAAITRTEARLADAEAVGDQAAANAARIRVTRLRDVRQKRLETKP